MVGRVFLSLPKAFLDALAAELGDGALDQDLWALEHRLAAGTTDSAGSVGFRDGRPLNYSYLFEPPPFEISAEMRAAWGWTPTKAASVSSLVDTRTNRFRTPIRGYCGWLLTNSEFLAEHDLLLTRWAADIGNHWLPSISEPAAVGEIGGWPPDMVAEFATFYARWRLTGLAGPYLPFPMPPQVPAPSVIRNRPSGGVMMFLPDTFPVPSREQLRDVIEDALRGGERPRHLAPWYALVRADNRAKTAFRAF